jgi:hypothetical protein
MTSSRPLAQGARELALVTLGYLVLTMALTYPAILHLGTRFLCDGFDCYQNVWNMWWLKTALLDLHTNPSHTTYLHHPSGITLLLQTFNPFNGLISLPLQAVFSLRTVYNLIVLFSFVASGLGMYYLARYLVGSRPAAFVAGVVYTFSPYHFAHGLGHLQLIAMEWLPVYILFIIKTFDEGGYRNATLAGLFLILTSLCDWYYLFYGLMLSLFLFLARARWLLKDRKRLAAIGVAMVAYLVPMSPILGPLFYVGLTQEFSGAHDPGVWSADLTSFFVPNAISTYGEITRPVWETWTGSMTENANYLGYVVLALAVIALIRVRSARFWGMSALIFGVLMLGPHPHLLGEIYTSVPLPYQLLHRYVPLFELSGMPTRFDILVKLCLAVMVAYALAERLQRSTRSARVKVAGVGLVTLAIAIEYLAIPFTTVQLEVPPFYAELARDSDVYGVVDIPLRPETLYFATVHEKPIVGGYVSRPTVPAMSYLAETPIISTLVNDAPLPAASDLPMLAREVFRDANIRYVITHGGVHEDLLENTLSFPVVDSRGGIRVYQVMD